MCAEAHTPIHSKYINKNVLETITVKECLTHKKQERIKLRMNKWPNTIDQYEVVRKEEFLCGTAETHSEAYFYFKTNFLNS